MTAYFSYGQYNLGSVHAESDFTGSNFDAAGVWSKYTIVDGEVYYRENSVMVKPDLNATASERVKGMIELRDCVQKLIGQQMDGFISDATIQATQVELNRLHDSYTAKFGLINSRANSLAFADDSSYFLLCSLEELDEERNLKRKADMFTKRTIRPHEVVTSVDTPVEALALSIGERGKVDMAYMSQLCGLSEEEIYTHLWRPRYFYDWIWHSQTAPIEPEHDDYMEMVLEYGKRHGVSERELRLLIDAGYDAIDLEELIHDDRFRENCIQEIMADFGVY